MMEEEEEEEEEHTNGARARVPSQREPSSPRAPRQWTVQVHSTQYSYYYNKRGTGQHADTGLQYTASTTDLL